MSASIDHCGFAICRAGLGRIRSCDRGGNSAAAIVATNSTSSIGSARRQSFPSVCRQLKYGSQALLQPATRRWHYVNIPLGAKAYDPVRDCEKRPEGDCLVAAIVHFQGILASRRMPKAERSKALRYLVHLIADAHQPLHCAERDGDAGGTLLKLTYFGTPLSLHQVWILPCSTAQPTIGASTSGRPKHGCRIRTLGPSRAAPRSAG